jgi:hypothetical protein
MGPKPIKLSEEMVSMRETTEVVQSVVDKVLQRVDAVASKLGLAATQVWGFTVKANIVNAKRDITNHSALMLVAFVLFGWSFHVVKNPTPHELRKEVSYSQTACPPNYPMGYQCQSSTERLVPDGDISSIGWALIISSIVTAIAGLLVASCAVEGIVDGISCLYTADYDAYKDLIYDWKD